MHFECGLEFRNDIIETTCLRTVRRSLGVAVHRITDPQHGRAHFLNRADHVRQVIFDRFGAKTVNQCQAARLIVGI